MQRRTWVALAALASTAFAFPQAFAQVKDIKIAHIYSRTGPLEAYGKQTQTGLLMALEPQVFMFDEPTAGMNAAEAPVILDLIRKLKQDKRKTILLVEHKMDVVRELADRIIVLHNGQLVADGEPAEVIASPIVQEAYLGGAKEAA